jgi:hypothetical protein
MTTLDQEQNDPNLYFMIEGGKALDVCKAFIAQRERAIKERQSLAKELGIDHYLFDELNGTLRSVRFTHHPHKDFTAAQRRGYYRPRKNSAWAKRFAGQPDHPHESSLISAELGIPTRLQHRSQNGHGTSHIGRPLYECGFLFLSVDGPYAMWIPDVEAEVARYLARGETVEEPALSFKAEFDGCRRILIQEWNLLVAQHDLADDSGICLMETMP